MRGEMRKDRIKMLDFAALPPEWFGHANAIIQPLASAIAMERNRHCRLFRGSDGGDPEAPSA